MIWISEIKTDSPSNDCFIKLCLSLSGKSDGTCFVKLCPMHSQK
jgi:hypothetical protein